MGFSKLPLIDKIVEASKRSSLPGFSGVSIYNVINFVYNEAIKEDNDIVTRSNSIAYSFFLSLFPAMIFLFTLLPMIPYTADYIEIFRDSTKGFLPQDAHGYLFNVIDGVASIKRGGLQSIGFLFAVIFSSSGMVTLMWGFNKSYEKVFKKRSFIKHRIIAIGLTIFVGTLFMTSMFLIIFGQPLIEVLIYNLKLGSYYATLINLFKWLIAVIVIYAGITLIYRYGSAMKQRITWINTGAILATTLSIISSLIFSFFINSFGRYNEIYGSIGALIVLMLWIQINVFVILVGFEFNASIAVNKADLMLRKQQGIDNDKFKSIEDEEMSNEAKQVVDADSVNSSDT